MIATRQGLQKFQNWMLVLREEGYDAKDRKWFADFWWERHDDDGELLPPGQRRSSDIREQTMSDELPPSPPGITLMSLQDFLGRRAAPAETPKADAVAIGERNAWEAKFNAECEKHDATTLRAMKAERDLALALDHIEKDDKDIERLNALMESNPSATTPTSGEISTAHVYRDAGGDMRIAIRYTDATEEDRPATALEVFLGCRSVEWRESQNG